MKVLNSLQGKRRYLAAGMVASALGFGVYGFAASLSISTKSLGANTVAVSGCTDTLTASYGTSGDVTYSATESPFVTGFTVAQIQITDSGGTNCVGKSAVVELTGASNAAEGSGTIASIVSGSQTVTITSGGDVQNVTGISVVATG